MSEGDEALLGVVMPPDEADPDGDVFLAVVDPSHIWERAAVAVQTALEMTRERLVELRAERERVNAEVRDLVAEEELLARMARIAEGRQRAEPTDG